MDNPQGPVALFTGATAGIGEAILKAYAKQHRDAHIYFVGRKEASAQRIIKDVREIWTNGRERTDDQGEIAFIQADLTLLRNVQNVVEEVKRRKGGEPRLDLLCMTQGYQTLKGRQETSEHHDVLLVLHFYSRAYLTYHLLPLLRSSNSPNGARVISILAPGYEGLFYLEDLGLKERHPTLIDWVFPGWLRRLTGLDPGFVMLRISHAIIMTTLFFEELARREREGIQEGHPTTETASDKFGHRGGKGNVSFLHVYPGLVKTQEFETGDFPAALKFFFTRIMVPLITPLTVAVERVGESVALMANDKRFGLARSIEDEQAEVAELGSDRVRGSGSYCLNWSGKRMVKDGVLEALRKKGARELVWEYFMEVLRGLDAVTDE